MPHELIVGLEAAAVAVLVLLLVPKRGLDHIRQRFSDLQAGRRRWLFEPPAGRAQQRQGARALAVDAMQMFELGVPVFVAGRLAEQRSAQLNQERHGRWSDSPHALLAAHLKGSVTEAELHGQLASRGWPMPAAKAAAKKVQARPLISVKWWLERQEMAHAMAKSNGDGPRETAPVASVAEGEADSDADEGDDAPEVESAASTTEPGHLRIRTFGRLELLQAGQDYGPLLMGKKMLAFIWLYLFVRRLLEPEGLVNRGAFAEEYSPGLSPPKQNKRLRGRLTDINEDLPAVLSSRVIADRLHLRLELSNSSIDIVRLQEVARLCVDRRGMLPPDLVAEARRMLEETEGELLAGWEDIEAETNGGRGDAKEYVRALREAAETARVDLLGALAANHMARQEPSRAVPLLEKALEHQPDRENLVRKLVAAYMETGQHTRAAELQKDRALDV